MSIFWRSLVNVDTIETCARPKHFVGIQVIMLGIEAITAIPTSRMNPIKAVEKSIIMRPIDKLVYVYLTPPSTQAGGRKFANSMPCTIAYMTMPRTIH
jgi:hypothetical protein